MKTYEESSFPSPTKLTLWKNQEKPSGPRRHPPRWWANRRAPCWNLGEKQLRWGRRSVTKGNHPNIFATRPLQLIALAKIIKPIARIFAKPMIILDLLSPNKVKHKKLSPKSPKKVKKSKTPKMPRESTTHFPSKSGSHLQEDLP